MKRIYLPNGKQHEVRRPAVWLAIPCQEVVYYQPFTSLLSLRLGPQDNIVTVSGLTHHKARNQLVQHFLDREKAEWLLFLDSDMTFPPDVVDKLMAHNKPIVSGLYFQKRPPYRPNMFLVNDVDPENGEWKVIEEWEENSLLEVDAVGAGCLLIHRSVFEKLAEPYFAFEGREGEDVYFCKQAKAAGFPIFVDTSVVCGHTSAMTVTIENFRSVRRRQERSK